MHAASHRRLAALGVDAIHALHFALIEQLGDAASDVLYRTGYEWGLQDMVRFSQQLHQDVGRSMDLWQMDVKFILDAWWATFVAEGWGPATFDCSSMARSVAFAELHESAVVPAFAGSDQPVCHLYAGLYAGALSFFERTECHAVELQCAAAGATACIFAIARGADIDAAETWRQQGMPTAEIVRRLR